MGWRDSYATLLELFPQVDPRLIKGAALEHGDDVGAAAEFILSDVLGSDEGTSDNVLDTTHHASNNSTEDLERRSLSSREEQAVIAAKFGFSLDGSEDDVYGNFSLDPSEGLRSPESQSGSSGLVVAEADAQELIGESPHEICDQVPIIKEVGEGVQPEVMYTVIGGSTSGGTETAEEDEILVDNLDIFQKFLLAWRKTRTTNSNIAEEVVHNELVEDNKSEVEILREESEAAPCDPSTSRASLTQEETSAESEDHGPGELVCTVSGNRRSLRKLMIAELGLLSGLQSGERFDSRIDEAISQMKEHNGSVPDIDELSVETSAGYHFHLEDEFLGSTGEVLRPAQEEDEVALDDIVGDSYADKSSSMLSIQKSAISEEMDRADWENVNSSSIIQLNQMEPLDDLVEEAKADKEALISSIEEIRVLRLMTDQAEYAARQAREEAVRGGLDVMANVEEMRKMLTFAREANAAHAGEVFGEKAVLATEARELQYRLAQVNQEKAKAVAALKEIKASLQARIESAVREREAAEQEKATKELLAKEALAKEEALVAKVAQESRDLDAEAEACTKIRDFLIERGSIVDALQGEVAVLREDAEALKKDLESMSLSYSGSHLHMLSSAGNDIYSSINSRFGKLSDLYGQPPSDSLVQVEDVAVSSGSNSGSLSLRSVSGVQKSTGDKKSWSSLPSLLSGLSGSQLSGSQDLNNSAHSGYSSEVTRDALIVNQGEKSPFLGLEISMTDAKYPSSPSSTNSPGGAQEERELLKAKMAMFPGEELEMEYSGIHNLDVFRTEMSNESRGEIDEEDWQLLEKGSSRSSSSSVGK